MIWKLIFIIAISVVTIEATRDDSDTELAAKPAKKYDLAKWKLDVWHLFDRGPKKPTFTRVKYMLTHLDRMNSFEHSDIFKQTVGSRRMKRIENYIITTKDIVRETTLLRKSKFITENLIDIFSNHIGCSKGEIFLLDKLGDIYGPQSRVNMAIQSLKSKTISQCWDSHKDLMLKTLNLVGKDIYSALDTLGELVKSSSLADFVSDQGESREKLTTSIGGGIASFFKQMEHPLIEDIEKSESIVEIEAMVKEMYDTEIHYPSTTFCDLLEPAKEHLARLRFMTHPGEKYLKHRRWHEERLVDFSCDLATIEFDSIKWNIMHNFIHRMSLNIVENHGLD